MTPAQTVTYDALCAVYERDGRVTVRGVAAASGVALTTTYQHLQALAVGGHVEWTPDTAATLRPTRYQRTRWVPLLRGTVRS